MNPDITVTKIPVDNGQINAVVLENADDLLIVPVTGIIGNSISTSNLGKQRTKAWKINVASTVKRVRGAKNWQPGWQYAISVVFSFCKASHGNLPLDVENFLKPSIDALAAGLFCDALQAPNSIARYNYDDSNFKYLFTYRLPDVKDVSKEGAVFCVSVKDN